MEFKKVSIEDLNILTRAISEQSSRACDISAGNLVFWRDYYDTSYYLGEDGFAVRFGNMEKVVSYYCGTNEALLSRLISLEGGTLRLSCVTEEEKEIIETRFECSDARYSEDWSDYLYSAEDIVTLRGKRFNGQRNHINKFSRLYPDALFCEISEENVAAVKDFCHGYFHSFGNEEGGVAAYEEEHIIEQLDNLEKYALHTGVLTVNGKIAGFSIGETVNDTLIIHTEKANTAYDGVYPTLVKLFAKRYVTEGTKYINREEDCGVAGLRTSKRSYHPLELLKKYSLVISEK